MNQVRVFDAGGKLKHIVSEKELIAISDRELSRIISFTGEKRRIKFKWYKCVECQSDFKSNSTKGAKWCPDCRKKVYSIRKKNSRKENK